MAPSIKEYGYMWRRQGQLINKYVMRLVDFGLISDKEEFFKRVGFFDDRQGVPTHSNQFSFGHNRVGPNPRTPMRYSELIACENEIMRLSKTVFADYLNESHCTDNIRVE
jgi:hypothetical protein